VAAKNAAQPLFFAGSERGEANRVAIQPFVIKIIIRVSAQ
jgi:hypothetical protein